MSMYRRYLLKKNFWAAPRKNGGGLSCYVKHDVRVGGIYAYIQNRGVNIVVNNESKFFNNFDQLDRYLDQLTMQANRTGNDVGDFYKVLTRRDNSKSLRHSLQF